VSNDERKFSMRVSVPPRDSTLSIIASTSAGESVPALVRLRWVGSKVTEPPLTLYALVIGINKYQNEALNLKYAAKDADDFEEELSKQKGKAYQDIKVQKLTNESATRNRIESGLQWLADGLKNTPNARAVFFFSGHGLTTTPELQSFLAPHDIEPSRPIATAITQSYLFDVLRHLHGRVLVFIDACHAGAGMEDAGIVGARRLDTNGLLNELGSAQNGIVSFASSKGDQLSLEDDVWENGAFTKVLVAGIGGKALRREGDNRIMTFDLESWLYTEVPVVTEGRQMPSIYIPPQVEPFAVALTK